MLQSRPIYKLLLWKLYITGPPNATACRVVSVIGDNFEVIYNPVTFATHYVIEVRNSTFIANYTTDDVRFAISDDVTTGGIYDVRVAARNPFGTSVYSASKSTSKKSRLSSVALRTHKIYVPEFWDITRVSNDTIELSWNKEFSDESYQVVTDPGYTTQVTGNSAILSGLDAGVTHSVNVSAFNGVKRILLFSIKQITGNSGIPQYFTLNGLRQGKLTTSSY